MEKEIQNEKILFSIDDDAYLLYKIYSLTLVVFTFLGLFCLALFKNKTEAFYDFGIFIFFSCLGVIVYSIQIYLHLKNEKNKIDFYENKIVKCLNGQTIYLNEINEMYRFIILLNYNKFRFRFSGLFSIVYTLFWLLLFVLIIYDPKVGLIFFSILLYAYIVSIFGVSIYLYIKNKKFIFTFKVRMLEIFCKNKVMSFALDNTDNHKLIENYFKTYANINLNEIKENITFKDKLIKDQK